MQLVAKTEFDLTTGDLARHFGVAPLTIARWADAGLIPCQRLPARGHRRFRPADVEALARSMAEGPVAA
ncbi:MerR-like DNA binding protein [Pseudonocardia autotrophica]|nr:MerR-like DNA binding protein [Pseudonocardia autotrophica]